MQVNLRYLCAKEVKERKGSEHETTRRLSPCTGGCRESIIWPNVAFRRTMDFIDRGLTVYDFRISSGGLRGPSRLWSPPPALGDGLTPSLTVVLDDAKF